MQQPGQHRAWAWRSGCYRRVGTFFVFFSGALLAFLERAEPRGQLRAVREQAPGVYEAQAAALQLRASFANLRFPGVRATCTLKEERDVEGAYFDFDVVHRIVLGDAQDEVLDTFGEAHH